MKSCPCIFGGAFTVWQIVPLKGLHQITLLGQRGECWSSVMLSLCHVVETFVLAVFFARLEMCSTLTDLWLNFEAKPVCFTPVLHNLYNTIKLHKLQSYKHNKAVVQTQICISAAYLHWNHDLRSLSSQQKTNSELHKMFLLPACEEKWWSVSL